MPRPLPRRTLRAAVEVLEPRDLPAAPYLTLPAGPDIDGAVGANVRRVAALGQQNGLNPNAFSKLGDSITYDPNYLTPIGSPGYNPAAAGLAGEPALIATVNANKGSFARPSLAAYPGWQVSHMLATADAEIAANRSGVAVIMIGTNDAALFRTDPEYKAGIEQLIDKLTAKGVIPILSTIPHRVDSGGINQTVDRFNQILVDVAEDRQVPLMNLTRVLDGASFGGLSPDGLHLSASPNGGGAFFPTDLLFGQNARGLLTIKALAEVREALATAPTDAIGASGLQPWSPLTAGERVAVAGPDKGQPPVVTVTDPATGVVRNRFPAFDASFTGGVRVAVADLNGDGVPDLVVGAGPGGGPAVKGIDGRTGEELFTIFAYEPEFRGGVQVAAGDLDGDGWAEVVVGSGVGGGPRVRVFRGSDLAVAADFMAFEPEFRGGVTVAVGDFGGGPEVVAGSGVGGGGVAKRFTPAGGLVSALVVFEPEYRGGVSVAAGDLSGDGVSELVVGSAAGATRVRVLSGDGSERAGFFADGKAYAGVRVGVVPARKGGRGVVLTGVIDRAGAVGLYDSDGDRAGGLVGSDAAVLAGGVYVGGG
jgi:hypothetical protein